MKKIINFFINIQKLKEKKRRGWIVHQIKDSESTASHIFRVAVLSWVLGRKKRLNIEKVLKIALIHDICEIFTSDETPYDPLLPKRVDSSKNRKKVKEILEKWPTFTFQQKKEKVRQKAERELRALRKLIADLPSDIKSEIEILWQDFEKGLSREGRFVKQADKAENLLQGLEYWEKYGRIQGHLWIRWAREIFDDPVLIEFERAIERRFFEKEQGKKEMDRILDFLIDIGKLKTIKREGWVLRKVPNPETIADHSFSTALMTWVLKRAEKISIIKTIKIALIHKLAKVYIEDFTPYDSILPNPREEIKKMIEEPSKFSKEEREKILNQTQKIYKIWPEFSKKTKEKISKKEYKTEKKAFQKVVSGLPQELGEEMLGLWDQFKKGLGKEGRFVRQAEKLESFLQACQYAKEDKNFPIEPWWIEIREKIDDPDLLRFIEALYTKKPFCK